MAESKPVALLTAAGSGMGAAAARQLMADGFDVAVMSSSGKGEALGNSLGGLGFTGSSLSPDDLGRFVDLTMARFGRIDAVVNSAGHGPKGPVLELTDDEWIEGLEVYLLSIIRVTRLVAPMMQIVKRGSIVNISTFAAVEPEGMFPTSAVFRAGLSAYTKLFADQQAQFNLRMNNILPGFIDSLPERSERRARIPLGRYGTVDEVAHLVSFLASDKSAYITGQNIRVDGGITRSLG